MFVSLLESGMRDNYESLNQFAFHTKSCIAYEFSGSWSTPASKNVTVVKIHREGLQKERVPINIVVGHNNRERSSQMTDESVAISITIKVEDVVMEFQEKVPIGAVKESVNSLSTGLGQQVLHGVIRVLDDRIARNIPADWRNVGTEMRWMVSSLGAVRAMEQPMMA
jgi:hypothetical protein